MLTKQNHFYVRKLILNAGWVVVKIVTFAGEIKSQREFTKVYKTKEQALKSITKYV